MAKAFSENEKSAIREKIKQTGKTLFLERGSKSLSVKEIASVSDISTGSFYSFFDSKESLFLELFIEEQRQIRYRAIEYFENQIANKDIPNHEKLTQLLITWIKYAISNKILHQYYISYKNSDLLNLVYNLYVDKNSIKKDLEDMETLKNILKKYLIILNDDNKRLYEFLRSFLVLAFSIEQFSKDESIIETIVRGTVKELLK